MMNVMGGYIERMEQRVEGVTRLYRLARKGKRFEAPGPETHIVVEEVGKPGSGVYVADEEVTGEVGAIAVTSNLLQAMTEERWGRRKWVFERRRKPVIIGS